MLNVLVLTVQERRKEMAKTVSKLSEDGKVAIRNVRREAIKQARLCILALRSRCSPSQQLCCVHMLHTRRQVTALAA